MSFIALTCAVAVSLAYADFVTTEDAALWLALAAVLALFRLGVRWERLT
jgi:hypothetical protein